MKFDGIGALIARIKTDAGIASKQLDIDQYQRLKKLCSCTDKGRGVTL